MEFDWHGFGRWVDGLRPWPYLLILWLLAWFALRLVQRLQLALKTHIVDRLGELRDSRRVETLMNVLRYAANIIIVVAAAMWTLAAVGISITPLLATAGVAGIAIGFGAQSLVKDFFTGLFLLIENQVSEGDMIEAAGKAGVVERVTLRHMRIRDYDGGLHFIPNSMITTVTNRSRGFSYAVVDVDARRRDDIGQVFLRMRRVSDAMRADSDFAHRILDDVEIAGVEKLGETTVSLRCRIKVRPAMQGPVRSEFLRRLKAALDEAGESPGSG